MAIPSHQPTSFPATLSESIARAKARAHGSREWSGVEWSGYIGRIPCSSKSSKSTPQASQPAFSTSDSAPAILFERDCFVDSFWGALWPDFRPSLNEMEASKSKYPAATVRGACSYGTYRSCHVTISNLWDLWRSRLPGKMRYSRGTSYLFELLRVVVLMGKAHKYNNSHKFEPM